MALLWKKKLKLRFLNIFKFSLFSFFRFKYPFQAWEKSIIFIIDNKRLVIDNNQFESLILGTDFYTESNSHNVWTVERIIRCIRRSHHTMFVKVVQD